MIFLHLLNFLYTLLAATMSIFGSFARSLARSIDYSNASRGPVDTDGARPRTHATERKVMILHDVLSKPLLTWEDLVSRNCFLNMHTLNYHQRAFNDFLKHGDEMDDRKMLVSRRLEATAHFLTHLPTAGGAIDQDGALQGLPYLS
jgi:hypothetical protein